MSDLFWPGDDRAGDHHAGTSFVDATVAVGLEWLANKADQARTPRAQEDPR